MRYFLIAGEASGDLHAGRLVEAIKKADENAEFRFYGGDEMARAAGCAPLKHYSNLAFMGFVQVLLHARTILRGLSDCKKAIREWMPHCVILVDYPGFNLRIARYVHQKGICPVFYYISPKIWAWKEGRIKQIQRDVDHLFSILPFEVDFFEGKHHYPITYVGNPSVDEISSLPQPTAPQTPIIALLPGSRTAEITSNLSVMLKAVQPYMAQGYRVVVAGAPSQPSVLYERIVANTLQGNPQEVQVEWGRTFNILQQATAALVTSGTATLETALIGTPQVVCYYTRCGALVKALKPYFLKVPFISLPNLICQREIIPELVGADMNAANLRRHLDAIMPGGALRNAQITDYADMAQRLGQPGAPQRCAEAIINRLKK